MTASIRSTDERNIVLIAANPHAGSKSRDRHLQEIVRWLLQRDLQAEISADLVHIERRAAELQRTGRLRALVGAGGDGTLAELVNRTEPGTPIAIYPAGTANLVARYVGVSIQCEAFGQMLLDGKTIELDAGRAGGRLFLAVCSCGFDAEVVRQLHAARTGHISPFTYFSPIVGALRSYAFPEMRVYCGQPGENGVADEAVVARWAFVSNLPCYAGGLKPGIGASGTDGQLDLCTLKQGSLWHGLRYLPHMFAGTQRNLADCTTARAERFRIESTEEIPYELDGDPGGFLPIEVEVLRRRLTLIVPRTFKP